LGIKSLLKKELTKILPFVVFGNIFSTGSKQTFNKLKLRYSFLFIEFLTGLISKLIYLLKYLSVTLMKIAITNDHAGYELKVKLLEYLRAKGIEVTDLGSDSTTPSDYPEFGHEIAIQVGEGTSELGISLCGSGNGISMTANKHPGIRSALCWNPEIAALSRKHNNANICALPARFISFEEAKNIVDAFLNSSFEGGRHQRRIDKIPL
jgi:ribose 5-phosphate isomerase B